MSRDRLGLRMGLLTLLGALVGVVAMTAFGMRFGIYLGEDTGRVVEALGRVDRERCASEAGDRSDAAGIEIYAYDASFEALTVGAPAIPEVLRARVRAGLRYPAELYAVQPWAGDMLVPANDSGACRYLMARWTSVRLQKVLRGELSLALGVLIGATTAVILWLELRPLRRRIEGLRRLVVRLEGAGRTHTPERQESPGSSGAPLTRDELRDLGAVEAALERSIARVDDHVQTIEAQRRGLETFLADVAHDVKTPLASLHLTIDELAAHAELEASELEASELDEAVRRLSGDVVYLRSLFTNLALAAQFRGGLPPIERVRFDLRGIVERVMLRAQVLARRSGLTLTSEVPEAPTWVWADESLVERLLENLVDNSLLHAADGEAVAVELRPRDAGDGADGFALRVLDDGPGVPPAELPRLGERTFRSDDARRRDRHGTGLGLAIVGEACARLGWSFALEARAPTGMIAVVEG
ncbi:MAG: HAMP domain-containing sensor histidine kinase [Nannocystaceae bacterium]